MRAFSTWIVLTLVGLPLVHRVKAQHVGQGPIAAANGGTATAVYSGSSLYWKGIDQPNGRTAIFRLDLVGTTIDTLVSSDTLGPNGVAVDSIRNQIYWTDNFDFRSRIMRANTDG